MYRRIPVGLAAAALALAFPLPAQAVDAPPLPPLTAQLAFQWSDYEQTDDGSRTTARGIATVGLLGDAERVLTDGQPSMDFSPTWSPDGRHLLYAEGAGEDGATVSVVPAQGGEPTQLAKGTVPAWSPDGRRIAYLDGRDADTELVVVDIEHVSGSWQLVPGTERRTKVPWAWTRPRWSPSGERLSFTVQMEPEDAWPMSCAVHVLEVDSGSIERLTDGLDVMCGKVEWSPSGRYLAFEVGDLEARTSGLTYVMGADGSDPRPALDDATNDFGYAWSPAADVLAVIVPGATGVAVVTATGGEVHRWYPPEHRSIFHVGWTPTATELIISAQRWEGPDSFGTPSHYWITPVGGGPLRQLTDSVVIGNDFAVLSPALAVRHFGATRIETAVALSRTAHERASNAVIVPASEAAHAFVGGPLAALVDGPLLLTSGDGLEPVVAQELRRLGVGEVRLLGDTTLLPARYEAELAALGIEAHRVARSSAAEIARDVAAEFDTDAAYVVRIDDGPVGWPDAVSVSALAAHQRRPVLLAGHSSLPAATSEAFRSGIAHATIVGGTAAVGEEVAADLRQLGGTVDRLAGRDRYATSRVVTERAAAAGLDATRPFVATGRNWPDSLSAGPAAAATGRVLLLVDGSGPATTATSEWLEARAGSLDEIGIVGGGAAVSGVVEAALEGLDR